MALTADEQAALDMLTEIELLIDGATPAVRKELTNLIYTADGQEVIAKLNGWK